MENPAELEKVRQEIMRLRELLTLLRGHLEHGERAHGHLFDAISLTEHEGIREKDLQLKAATLLLHDCTPLRAVTSRLAFEMRQMEQAFSELRDIVDGDHATGRDALL